MGTRPSPNSNCAVPAILSSRSLAMISTRATSWLRASTTVVARFSRSSQSMASTGSTEATSTRRRMRARRLKRWPHFYRAGGAPGPQWAPARSLAPLVTPHQFALRDDMAAQRRLRRRRDAPPFAGNTPTGFRHRGRRPLTSTQAAWRQAPLPVLIPASYVRRDCVRRRAAKPKRLKGVVAARSGHSSSYSACHEYPVRARSIGEAIRLAGQVICESLCAPGRCSTLAITNSPRGSDEP